MDEDFPYVAFEIPDGVDPDDWARAYLEQVDRDIAQGRRKSTDRPRVFISSASSRGAGNPLQVIAESDAYRTVVNFDCRKFEADELRRRDLPADMVEVRERAHRPGRTCCFEEGLWRIVVTDPTGASLDFLSDATGDGYRLQLLSGEAITAERLEVMYAHELGLLFLRASGKS